MVPSCSALSFSIVIPVGTCSSALLLTLALFPLPLQPTRQHGGPFVPTGSHSEAVRAHLTKAMCTFKTSTKGFLQTPLLSRSCGFIPASRNTMKILWWIKGIFKLRQTQTGRGISGCYSNIFPLALLVTEHQSLTLYGHISAQRFISRKNS